MPECGFAHSVQSERDFVDEGFACMLGVQHAYDVLCSRAPRGRYMDPRLLYDEHLLDNPDDYAITPFDNCKGIETRLSCFPPRYSPTFRGSRPTMGTTASCLDEVGDVYGGCADNRAPMPMPRSCLKGSRPLLAEDCTGGVACTNIRRVLFSPVESDSTLPLTRIRAPRPCSDLIPGFKAGSLSNLAQALRLTGGSATHAIGPAEHDINSHPPASGFKAGSLSNLAQIATTTASIPPSSHGGCPQSAAGFKAGSKSNLAQASSSPAMHADRPTEHDNNSHGPASGFKAGSVSNLAQLATTTAGAPPSSHGGCQAAASRAFHGGDPAVSPLCPVKPVPSDPAGEPPSLLSAHASIRPSLLAKDNVEGLQVLPASLAAQGRLTLNAAQLRLCSAAAPGDPAAGYYTAFDRQRHSTIRKSSPDWSAEDFLADAIQACPEAVACVQFLQPPLPDLPLPQLTLTPPGLGPGVLAVAVDMRRLQGSICTVLVAPGCDKTAVLDAIAAACPEHSPALHLLAAQDAVFLQDAAGAVRDTMPLRLEVLQWLSIQLDATGPLGMHGLQGMTFALPVSGHTTGTTTFALPAGSSVTVQTVSFVLVGGGTLIRLVPQPWNEANVVDSLTELLFVLALQGRMPERPMLQIAAATPKLSDRHNTYMVCFLVFPEGPDIHILQDHSVDGSLLQGFSVDAGTRPVHMLSDAHARRGYSAFLNGIAHTAANRELATGDLVQIRQGDYFAEAVPPGRLYRLLPDLRFFALPIPVPSMQALSADPLSASLQVRAKDALKRTLQLRVADRRQHFGTPARSNQPIIVLGPGHPALHLQMDQALTPGFQEAVDFIQAGEYLPAGTTFADPLVMEWTTPVFISIPPGSVRRTLLYPSPHFSNYLQVSVPPRLPLEGLPLPVRRGFVAVFPPHTESHFVILERRDPQARRPSSASTPATSLLQLDKKLLRASVPTPQGRRSLVLPLAAQQANKATADFPRVPTLCEWAEAWAGDIPFRLHGQARAAIQHRHPPGVWAPSAIHVYADGSAKRNAPLGWAAAVFEECSDGVCSWLNFLGSFSSTTVSFASQGLCGSEHNVDAEAVALTAASVWALAWPENVQLHLWSDCQCVIDAAAGRATPHLTGNTNRLLRALRCVWQALERRACPAALHWVPGHSGVPANELADQLAKHACTSPSAPLPGALFQLLKHQHLPWLWHILTPAPGLPPFERLLSGQYEAPDPVPEECLPTATCVRKRVGCPGQAIGLCTFNVQTLRGKKDILRRQFTALQLHVVFLQETRLPAGTCCAQDYVEVRSPC